jgi:hypothetical protein
VADLRTFDEHRTAGGVTAQAIRYRAYLFGADLSGAMGGQAQTH